MLTTATWGRDNQPYLQMGKLRLALRRADKQGGTLGRPEACDSPAQLANPGPFREMHHILLLSKLYLHRERTDDWGRHLG